MELSELVREIPDYPNPGINFKDITPLLADAAAFAAVIASMADPYRAANVDLVAGVEARGFIFGAAIAAELGCGFLPIRKPGKLPSTSISIEYELEYGTDILEIHVDACGPGDSVLLIDDVLATGGTLRAAQDLIAQTGAELAGVGVFIELGELEGVSNLAPAPFRSLLRAG